MQPKTVKRYQKKEKSAPRHGYALKRNKSRTEVTIEQGNPDEDICYQAPILILHVGSRFIEVTATSEKTPVATWVTDTLHVLRHMRRGGGPLVIGLSAFRGFPEKNCFDKLPTGQLNHPLNPYRAIAICLGGSHVLFYHHYDSSWHRNDEFSVKPLEDLLGNKKAVVIGVGIKEIAKKLQDQWHLSIKRPVDLRKVVASAHGKEAVWWPKYEKGRVVIEERGLEGMAKLVLEGMRLEKKPASVLKADRGGYYSDEMDMEMIKYVARDAFLSYEIAVKCIEKTGLLPED